MTGLIRTGLRGRRPAFRGLLCVNGRPNVRAAGETPVSGRARLRDGHGLPAFNAGSILREASLVSPIGTREPDRNSGIGQIVDLSGPGCRSSGCPLGDFPPRRAPFPGAFTRPLRGRRLRAIPHSARSARAFLSGLSGYKRGTKRPKPQGASRRGKKRRETRFLNSRTDAGPRSAPFARWCSARQHSCIHPIGIAKHPHLRVGAARNTPITTEPTDSGGPLFRTGYGILHFPPGTRAPRDAALACALKETNDFLAGGGCRLIFETRDGFLLGQSRRE